LAMFLYLFQFQIFRNVPIPKHQFVVFYCHFHMYFIDEDLFLLEGE